MNRDTVPRGTTETFFMSCKNFVYIVQVKNTYVGLYFDLKY